MAKMADEVNVPAQIGNENAEIPGKIGICEYCKGNIANKYKQCKTCNKYFHKSCFEDRHKRCNVHAGEHNLKIGEKDSPEIQIDIEEEELGTEGEQTEGEEQEDATEIIKVLRELIRAKDRIIKEQDEVISCKNLIIDLMKKQIPDPDSTDKRQEAPNREDSVKQQTSTVDTAALRTAIASMSTVNREIQPKRGELQEMERVQKEKMKKIINLEKTTVEKAQNRRAENTMESRWSNIVAQKKDKISHKRLGTGTTQDEEFKGAERMAWLYLYRIKSASEGKITQYIQSKENFKNVSIRVKEIPGDPNRLKRFVIGAPLDRKDDLYSTDFWPTNIGIKRFDFRRHRAFMESNSGHFL